MHTQLFEIITENDHLIRGGQHRRIGGQHRRNLHTANSIENGNRGIRKYTKTKVQFPDDQAAEKAVYLAIMNIDKKWSMLLHNWGLVLHQFVTIFEDRCRL